MGERRTRTIRLNVVLLFVQYRLGKLPHKATTHTLTYHGTWAQRMTYVLIDPMTVAMTVAMGVTMFVSV